MRSLTRREYYTNPNLRYRSLVIPDGDDALNVGEGIEIGEFDEMLRCDVTELIS